MATGAKKGLNALRKVGSNTDSRGLNTYSIVSGFGTILGLGDPVKLVAGFLNRATNDTADAIGTFAGVNYIDSLGEPKFSGIWPAGTVATEIVALVVDDPAQTFTAIGDATVAAVVPGEIYAVNLTDADSFTKQSTVDVAIGAGTVAASSGMVKIISVLDVANNVLEVVLVDHALRDNG